MALWNNLKLWLASALAAGSLMMPSQTRGDSLEIQNYGNSSDVFGSVMYIEHNAGYGEYEGGDTKWDDVENLNNKWLKIFTEPYSIPLYLDGRPNESETKFQAKLSVVDKIGNNATSTNQIGFLFYDGPDATRHYTAKINCDTNYTPNHTSFSTNLNIRDVIDLDEGIVNLPGITNVPNGTIYGTCDVDCKFNRLVSTKTGNGTNSFEGNAIFNYNDSTNVTLCADTDYYVKQYTLRRTDNVGNVSVITTNVPGQTNRYDVAIPGIKGSNSLESVFAPKTTINGIPHTWLTKYGITNKTDSVETQHNDADTMNNLQEFIADTNPTNELSYFSINNFRENGSYEMELLGTATNRIYTVYSKTNLLDTGEWNFETNSYGNGSNLVFHLNGTYSDSRFYRSTVKLPE